MVTVLTAVLWVMALINIFTNNSPALGIMLGCFAGMFSMFTYWEWRE